MIGTIVLAAATAAATTIPITFIVAGLAARHLKPEQPDTLTFTEEEAINVYEALHEHFSTQLGDELGEAFDP